MTYQKIKQILFAGVAATYLIFTPLYAANNTEKQAPKALPIEDVQRFTRSLEMIRKLYVEPVTDKELLENAVRGMLEGLDPHSSYLDEKSFKVLNVATKGQFGGLGIEVTLKHGVVQVVTPLDDTPAYKAGIKSGDLIVQINGEPVSGMTLDEAVGLMRGKKGSAIELLVVRQGEAKPLPFKIVRDVIKVVSVKHKFLDEKKHYGYIRIASFQSKTGRDVKNAVKALQKDSQGKLEGIVLDLRNNPGGVLDAAVDVSDTFLDAQKLGENKKIVYTKGRLPQQNMTKNAKTADMTNGMPIVVLINSGSASASEIVAGALKDQKRAVILGMRSFGKGSVQTVLPLDDKRALKLTTSLYYTPSGTSIQADGIEPDVLVEQFEVPKQDKLDPRFRLNESSLRGHLMNGQKEKAEKEKKEKIAKEKKLTGEELVKKYDDDKKDETLPLVNQDYQLYEALNVLKSLIVAHAYTR